MRAQLVGWIGRWWAVSRHATLTELRSRVGRVFVFICWSREVVTAQLRGGTDGSFHWVAEQGGCSEREGLGSWGTSGSWSRWHRTASERHLACLLPGHHAQGTPAKQYVMAVPSSAPVVTAVCHLRLQNAYHNVSRSLRNMSPLTGRDKQMLFMAPGFTYNHQVSAAPCVSIEWPSSFEWALRNKHLQARYGRAGHNLTSASARVAFVWWNSSNPPADGAIRPAIRTHTERILTRIWSSVTPGCPTTLPLSQPLSPGVRCLTAVCADLDTLSELVVFSRFPGSRPLGKRMGTSCCLVLGSQRLVAAAPARPRVARDLDPLGVECGHGEDTCHVIMKSSTGDAISEAYSRMATT